MLPIKSGSNGIDYMVSENTEVAYRKDGTPVALSSLPHLKYARTVAYTESLYAWQQGRITWKTPILPK